MKSFFNKLFASWDKIMPKSEGKKKVRKKDDREKAQTLLEEDGNVELRMEVPSKKGYVVAVGKDDFTGDFKIKFNVVASNGGGKLITWSDEYFCNLDLAFCYEDKKHLMTIATYQKNLKFKVGDKLSFLFEDGEIIEFDIEENGYRIDRDTDGIIIESKFPIDKKHIWKFESSHLKKWRYTPCDGTLKRTGTIMTHENKEDFGEMASVYLELVTQFIK